MQFLDFDPFHNFSLLSIRYDPRQTSIRTKPPFILLVSIRPPPNHVSDSSPSHAPSRRLPQLPPFETLFQPIPFSAGVGNIPILPRLLHKLFRSPRNCSKLTRGEGEPKILQILNVYQTGSSRPTKRIESNRSYRISSIFIHFSRS